MTTVLARICPRRDTAANFTSANPVLESGEMGRETDTGKVKFGDGTTAWNSLAYWTPATDAETVRDVIGAALVAGSGITVTVSDPGDTITLAVDGAVIDERARDAVGTALVAGANTSITVNDGADTITVASTIVLAQSAVAVAHTGTTAETTLATITIPANTMGANGRVEIEVLWTHTNNANTKTERVKFGATTFSSIAVTTTATSRQNCFVANRGATNSQVGGQPGGIGANLGPYGVGTASITTAAIDTTAAVNITFTAQLANAADTITLESYSVKLFK